MKIGAGSRIMMKSIVMCPWRIRIGKNTTVNEYCYLDGRGGLEIGNNVNIALFSMLITGSHRTHSPEFEYYAEPIKIEDGVWLAARSTILNGCILKAGCIVGAGAIVMPHSICACGTVYAGVPAEAVRERELESPLEMSHWDIHFR